MHLRKWLISLVALCVSSAAFAYAAPDDDDPVVPLLEQYREDSIELQKQFDAHLLAPLKGMASILLQMKENRQEEPNAAQEKAWEQYNEQLATAFEQMVSKAMANVDMEQVNAQYQQMMKNMGVENPEPITKEMMADMIAGMYLITALDYFTSTKKLSQKEFDMLTLILFPPEEEEE